MLAVLVQYVKDGELTTVILGLFGLYGSVTAEQIRVNIQRCLNEWEIRDEQLVSVVTDGQSFFFSLISSRLMRSSVWQVQPTCGRQCWTGS